MSVYWTCRSRRKRCGNKLVRNKSGDHGRNGQGWEFGKWRRRMSVVAFWMGGFVRSDWGRLVASICCPGIALGNNGRNSVRYRRFGNICLPHTDWMGGFVRSDWGRLVASICCPGITLGNNGRNSVRYRRFGNTCSPHTDGGLPGLVSLLAEVPAMEVPAMEMDVSPTDAMEIVPLYWHWG